MFSSDHKVMKALVSELLIVLLIRVPVPSSYCNKTTVQNKVWDLQSCIGDIICRKMVMVGAQLWDLFLDADYFLFREASVIDFRGPKISRLLLPSTDTTH